MKVGMAAGRLFTRGEHRHRVVIGKDTRLSGYMIEPALVAGFTAVGMDVFQFGPLPTPAVAMLVRSLRADLGVMISASHNPYHDNGIKLFGPDGNKLSDDDRARDRSADGQRPGDRPCRPGRARPRQARRRQPGALHRIRQAHLPEASEPRRHAHRHRLRQWRGLQGGAGGAVGAGRGNLPDRRRRPTASTSISNAARPSPKRWRPRCARCAPISASRSTATPTGW